MKRTAMFYGVAALIAGCAFAGPSASAASNAPMSQLESACRALGPEPGEAPYAYCIQSLAESAPARSYAMNPPTQMSDAAADGGNTGYRAENACAAIGLNPATARYSDCVGNLNQILFDEQNVSAR